MHVHRLSAGGVKFVIHFHAGNMNTINIDVNIEMTFLQSPSSDMTPPSTSKTEKRAKYHGFPGGQFGQF
ncbi:MAG: hypothetical protein Pars2KO_26270 [Parasphingorhabdus sp.]